MKNYSISLIRYLLHIALKYNTVAMKHIFGTLSSVLCQDYLILVLPKEVVSKHFYISAFARYVL